jgi:hypothetical protein
MQRAGDNVPLGSCKAETSDDFRCNCGIGGSGGHRIFTCSSDYTANDILAFL